VPGGGTPPPPPPPPFFPPGGAPAGGGRPPPPPPLHFFAMGGALGGGETATLLAGVVGAAANAFLVEFPVEDPCFLFESAVHVVRSNGRASFARCKGEFRSAGVQTPSAGQSARPSCSPASFALPPAAVPPPPRRLTVAGADDPVAVALSIPPPPVPASARAGGVDSGEERTLGGVSVAAVQPHGGPTGGVDAAPPSPPPRGRVSPLPPFAAWPALLRRDTRAISSRPGGDPAPALPGGIPSIAADPVVADGAADAPWTLVLRRCRRRRRAAPAASQTPSPTPVAGVGAVPRRGADAPTLAPVLPGAGVRPPSVAGPPPPPQRAADADAALTHGGRGDTPSPPLTTV